MSDPTDLTRTAPPPRPRAPRRALPAGACDTHAHVFGPVDRYPWSQDPHYRPADRFYVPPLAPVDDYLVHLDALGLELAVLVQPNVYGTDLRCLLDALVRLGPRARGVGVVEPTLSAGDLRKLHDAGLRGLRFHAIPTEDFDALEGFARRLAPLGWFIEIYAPLTWIAQHAARLATFPCPLVFDHFGGLAAGASPACEFDALVRLVAEGPAWVKLSGPFRATRSALPYRELAPCARALADAAPDRLLWGSDWPYARVPAPVPSGGDLLDALAEWLPDETLQHAVLVGNPRMLFGFD